jgi:mannose-6-phosphate isomerase-like protein (cupin superfamily)
MASAKDQAVSPVVISAESLTRRAPETFPIDNTLPSRGDVTWLTLFSSSTTPTNSLTAGLATCPPGTGHLCAHRHEQAEIYYVTEGRGIMTIDGTENQVGPGSAVFVPGNAEHGIRNVGEGELKWFYVFGTDRFEDVVYRFS